MAYRPERRERRPTASNTAAAAPAAAAPAAAAAAPEEEIEELRDSRRPDRVRRTTTGDDAPPPTRERARRRGSTSSVHSAGSMGSLRSTSKKKDRSNSGSGTSGDRERRPGRTRGEHRERRLATATGTATGTAEEEAGDTASAYSRSSGAGGGTTGSTVTSEINYEDELERIKESRARRLRNERAAGTVATATTTTTAAAAGDRPRSRSPKVRERRRDREGLGAAGTASTAPFKGKSTPEISRRELEEAGLVRKERRRNNKGEGSSPIRIRSEGALNTGRRRRGAGAGAGAGGDDDGSAYSARRRDRERDDDDNASAYSRASRRDRDRDRDRDRGAGGDQDDTVSAYSRARRDRVTKRGDQDDDQSSNSRARRDRDRDRGGGGGGGGGDEESSASVYARARERRERITHQSGDDESSSVYSRASRRDQDEESTSAYSRSSDQSSQQQQQQQQQRASRGTNPSSLARTRATPTRSYTAGNDGLRATDREGRRPPQRAKSADQDLLAMGKVMEDESISHQQLEKGKRRPGRQNDPHVKPASRSRSTDLTSRLRERREARVAERSNSDAKEEPRQLESEVERRLAMRRSNDDSMEDMRASVGGEVHLPELELSSLSQAEQDQWSVKIGIVSAVDLPQNIVPNIPLCPIFKLGFVRIPDGDTDVSYISRKLANTSIQELESARVRSTTTKIMSKRDNGSIDFHQELRWDGIPQPSQVALVVELSARAVRSPTNMDESPPAANQQQALDLLPPPTKRIAAATHDQEETRPERSNTKEPVRHVSRTTSASSDDDLGGGLRAFWRKATNRKASELEAAEAAAAVARMLIEQDRPPTEANSEERPPADSAAATAFPGSKLPVIVSQSDYDVALQNPAKRRKLDDSLTEDVIVGTLIIPLSQLPLKKATERNEIARIEKWYQLDSVNDGGGLARKKNPSVLLEISFAPTKLLDDSEGELEQSLENSDSVSQSAAISHSSFSKMNSSIGRMSTIEPAISLKEEKPSEEDVDPVLEPGVVDYVAMVGVRDIGNQKNDNGTKGWVKSSPECMLLEQFPPDNEFHHRAGRTALMPEMLQWFAFPEGTRLWRGTAPPSHTDLNLKRFSAASPPSVASSIAAFDACLNCTTSFSWFVIASNSDKYGSKLVKTYTAVIRFYAPAPDGIDPTQEDFAQSVLGQNQSGLSRKRLWVPVGICLTSGLPIIGVMEAMLLRLCEDLVSRVGPPGGQLTKLEDVHKALTDLIVNFEKPIAGAVNCSVPFLSGDRFLLSLPPPASLPALPHGKTIVSVCRLLGAEGLNYLLAAVLTECKILIHSQDIADIAMVAEVVTALTYPFTWSLPYIPILPVGMLEFVEAPLSYILGIPSCNLKLLDPHALDDTVLIDLDNGFTSPEYLDSRKSSRVGNNNNNNKHPTPLPASVASNISTAVYKLLRAEEEVEEEYTTSNLGFHSLPRLEAESLAEREFRVSLAIEICGLLRGYQECIGQVFNRDKFLKISPALLEERREHKGVGASFNQRQTGQGKIISARSKRFLSMLVNTQNFYQLLESLESEEATFFNEVLEAMDESSTDKTPGRMADNGARPDKVLAQLMKSLQKLEDKIPTYRVGKITGSDDPFEDDDDDDFYFDDEGEFMGGNFDDLDDLDAMSSDDPNMMPSFTSALLLPIENDSKEKNEDGQAMGISMEYLAKLEKTPWQYQRLLDIPIDENGKVDQIAPGHTKVKLREAIGERRYHTWKMARDQKKGADVEVSLMNDNLRASKEGSALDLTSLISSASAADISDSLPSTTTLNPRRNPSLTPEQQRVADAKDRDVIRRCLDRANRQNEAQKDDNPFLEKGRDLLAESEKALRNPSAQQFFLSILAQRARLENQRVRTSRRVSAAAQSSVSRLDAVAFECLIRLSCAMLDSCMEFNENEAAYRLLTFTAGFITLAEPRAGDGDEKDLSTRPIISMTSRIGFHPIFAELSVWETVMNLHLEDRRTQRKSEVRPTDEETDDEEEEAEAEYEAAVATLYEMLGYGIPGEELSRFAMRTSEENGWFIDDRGRQLLVLARRISVRRDQTEAVSGAGDPSIDMISNTQDGDQLRISSSKSDDQDSDDEVSWLEVGWCHPAAPTSRSGRQPESSVVDDSSTSEYMKRSPVTALASFGSSVVVTGGLDGGVFLAYSIGDRSPESTAGEVRGLHLDWGSASRAGMGASSDGEYGVGAVSCIAAAVGSGYHAVPQGPKNGTPFTTEDRMESMEGSRVVAGTTAGDLRVWSVKDIYSALLSSKDDEDEDGNPKGHASGSSAFTRLKFSLRGRALSGHRGGVTCIDVPSQVYRPDSLVTGGADGLIKLWSLRAPTSGRRQTSQTHADNEGAAQQRGRGGDALSVLNGHDGRVLCVKTAWHGDRLLSGGADRTVRVWDLAASGKCLNVLSGHSGWITQIQYWGPNTIVSGSTDRSLALWDARIRTSPLFLLRHHQSPVSDVVVGSRTDPLMVSAAADGSIATWDFRALSSSPSGNSVLAGENKSCNVARQPKATMSHGSTDKARVAMGQVFLSRSVTSPMTSILSVGSDAIVREWDMASSKLKNELPTGHSDAVSSFQTCSYSTGLSSETDYRTENIDGIISSSWDGTIKLRRLTTGDV